MKTKSLDLMREATQLIGIAGDEKAVSQYLKKYYEELCDEVIYDNLGSIFAVKKCGKENAKKVMVCAHMDEVGFMITEIQKNGLLSFIKIGSIEDSALYASRISLKTRDGSILPGSIVMDEESLKKMMKIR